jgi:hypothetical protein
MAPRPAGWGRDHDRRTDAQRGRRGTPLTRLALSLLISDARLLWSASARREPAMSPWRRHRPAAGLTQPTRRTVVARYRLHESDNVARGRIRPAATVVAMRWVPDRVMVWWRTDGRSRRAAGTLDGATLLSALAHDQPTTEQVRACARLAGFIRVGEDVLAVEPCLLRKKPSVLALTDKRLHVMMGTRWPGCVAPELPEITTVLPVKDGLLVQSTGDSGKFGVRIGSEAAERVVEQLAAFGVPITRA